MRRSVRWLVPVACTLGSLLFVAACVGDDPLSAANNANDAAGGADGTINPNDGGGNGGEDGSSEDGAVDGGADAEPLCGYPGEDCCGAPALPCRSGTVCGTGNNKCMVSELGAVTAYFNVTGGNFTNHIASAFYDGTTWTAGPDIMTEASLSTFHTTDLVSGGQGSYHVTLFKSSEGKMFNFSSALWRKCEPGQACNGPALPPPAFWSVGRISNDTWIGATNKIFRCVPGGPCSNQVAGLESTTWGTGKIVGTTSQDIWFSALTRAFHFDGTSWTIHDGLKARTIYEVRKDDVWVGDRTLQHWNGTAWSNEFAVDGAPAPGIITSISGASSTDIWAVGYNGSDGSHPAFTAHWNGTAWSLKPVPAGAAGNAFVYAPSSLEAFLSCDESGLYRWNGTQWVAMTMPSFNTGDAPASVGWEYVTGPAKPRP